MESPHIACKSDEGTPAQRTRQKGQERCYQNFLRKSVFFVSYTVLTRIIANTFAKRVVRITDAPCILARPLCKSQLGKELQVLASRHYRHPTQNKWITSGSSTLERWYNKALNATDPIEALGRKQRSDADITKAISPQLLAALQRQYHRYPDWQMRPLIPPSSEACNNAADINRNQSDANRVPSKNWPQSALNSAW